jgi:aminopeptidase N
LLDQDSESLQSHELAHQWFGDYVTCRDWGQIWLNESFATYMQAMWTEKLKGHEEFLYSDIRSNHDQVLGSWSGGDRRPIVTKYYANKDAMFDNYAYPGGGSVLHMLRKHLGDKLFYKSLNHYLTTNAHHPSRRKICESQSKKRRVSRWIGSSISGFTAWDIRSSMSRSHTTTRRSSSR